MKLTIKIPGITVLTLDDVSFEPHDPNPDSTLIQVCAARAYTDYMEQRPLIEKRTTADWLTYSGPCGDWEPVEYKLTPPMQDFGILVEAGAIEDAKDEFNKWLHYYKEAQHIYDAWTWPDRSWTGKGLIKRDQIWAEVEAAFRHAWMASPYYDFGELPNAIDDFVFAYKHAKEEAEAYDRYLRSIGKAPAPVMPLYLPERNK